MSQEQAIAETAKPSGTVTSHMANEFLTFRLGGEEYGIEILKVQENRG
ncbi:MAG: chemotaxis protein CheW, partial [Nitrosomonas sp.]|nr:chemotaxis protein CheW [Nitrosomonas sp.]